MTSFNSIFEALISPIMIIDWISLLSFRLIVIQVKELPNFFQMFNKKIYLISLDGSLCFLCHFFIVLKNGLETKPNVNLVMEACIYCGNCPSNIATSCRVVRTVNTPHYLRRCAFRVQRSSELLCDHQRFAGNGITRIDVTGRTVGQIVTGSILIAEFYRTY